MIARLPYGMVGFHDVLDRNAIETFDCRCLEDRGVSSDTSTDHG